MCMYAGTRQYVTPPRNAPLGEADAEAADEGGEELHAQPELSICVGIDIIGRRPMGMVVVD